MALWTRMESTACLYTGWRWEMALRDRLVCVCLLYVRCSKESSSLVLTSVSKKTMGTSVPVSMVNCMLMWMLLRCSRKLSSFSSVIDLNVITSCKDLGTELSKTYSSDAEICCIRFCFKLCWSKAKVSLEALKQFSLLLQCIGPLSRSFTTLSLELDTLWVWITPHSLGLSVLTYLTELRCWGWTFIHIAFG